MVEEVFSLAATNILLPATLESREGAAEVPQKEGSGRASSFVAGIDKELAGATSAVANVPVPLPSQTSSVSIQRAIKRGLRRTVYTVIGPSCFFLSFPPRSPDASFPKAGPSEKPPQAQK